MSWLDVIISLIPKNRPTPSPTPAPHPLTPVSGNDLADAINAQRAKYGLRPLVLDTTLNNLAQSWAETMARNGKMDHGDFSGRIKHAIPAFRNAGEDIAAGQTTVTQVVTAWMNSPPHRANILGNFNSIGVGIAKGTMIFWCLDFDLVN